MTDVVDCRHYLRSLSVLAFFIFSHSPMGTLSTDSTIIATLRDAIIFSRSERVKKGFMCKIAFRFLLLFKNEI